jgi:hypothetical protein
MIQSAECEDCDVGQTRRHVELTNVDFYVHYKIKLYECITSVRVQYYRDRPISLKNRFGAPVMNQPVQTSMNYAVLFIRSDAAVA